MKVVLYHTLVTLLLTKSISFQVAQTNRLTTRQTTNNISSSSALFIIPEIAVTNVAVAIASAAAGAATQIPKIQELEAQKLKLEKELEQAKNALTSSEKELLAKISHLEDAMFEMDREFEGQTARAKRKYDSTLRNELEDLTVRLKSEFEATLKHVADQFEEEKQAEIQMQEKQLRYNFLQEVSDNRRNELANTLNSQARLSVVNRELEEALGAAKKELESLNDMKNSKSWWPF